ncbi:hypothetical protein [Paludisphaera mucosa]|uniref:Lipoprotein n=1 Tax=Paludisphaera mucosa TaxID=3030827 RepID=A0ABT6FD53_9BACT|nr:hypothetical protein [Paludisphaera mucosa]MDG3005523.1 hypothetical protein [Paludisphaera mucosa]
MTRRTFGSACACAAFAALAAAVSGCDDAGVQTSPEIKNEAEESRRRSMEAMQKKAAVKHKP